MPVIRRADCRRTETPNAVMTTLASPTQGGAGQAVWRVDMRPGQAGPLHAMDAEQIWTVLAGQATVALGTGTVALAPGDTLVIPADAPRRVVADATRGFAAIVVAPAGTRAYPLDGTVVAADCAVPDGDKLVPAWVI
ncbi:MAG: cupin domain-containing protein [Micromonosporaceae bacterium]|jgi:quercetin dioxygenase-like cupin family protein|nr:cupin domain-containing protein [Micromonosporaceae bacterium]